MLWQNDTGNKFTDADLVRVLRRLGMVYPEVVVWSGKPIVYKGCAFNPAKDNKNEDDAGKRINAGQR